jgi:hypothetical protein
MNKRSVPQSPRAGTEGFALVVVMVLLALMTTAVATTLDSTVETIRTGGQIKASEMVKVGIEHGLNQAIAQVQASDPMAIMAAGNDWDIFNGANVYTAGGDFMDAILFPPAGAGFDFSEEYRIRIGLRPSQRARAPSGEDATQSYGQVVEIQLAVEAIAPMVPPSEERVTVGVVVPRQKDGA